ncbi:AAA family ATPase [Candidatus Deianiraea vastatrix]|uniref:Phage-related P-loop NTPase n=1 Tax=Candidatus Deianiraea vastatrix TaxID=2163644 RepID=A0A5B8XDI6_9RICK|nr:AAA family ATPase [Candidatus Deianiraea vastatrix]QED22945.1 Putative phage-related P-loop NTPase [Candidatus Deianiraea vastatrix]
MDKYLINNALPVVNGERLLQMDIPPLQNIIDPILPVGGMGLIFAKRGIGKTHFCIEIAYAVANGIGFLNWSASKSRKVLYLDLETQIAAIKQRFEVVHNRLNIPNGMKNIELFNHALFDKNCTEMLNIDNDRHREILTNTINNLNVDLIIMDNLSSIRRSGNENDAKDCHKIIEWALLMRKNDKSIIFVGHEGKKSEGDAKTLRGSSRMEDVVDTIINLSEIPNQKGNIKLMFTKHRHMSPDLANPINMNFNPENGWSIIGDYIPEDEKLMKKRNLEILQLKLQGIENKEICSKFQISKSEFSKIINKCKFIKDEMRKVIDSLLSSGKTESEVAKILGVKNLSEVKHYCYNVEVDFG